MKLEFPVKRIFYYYADLLNQQQSGRGPGKSLGGWGFVRWLDSTAQSFLWGGLP
jgi:hypothetical protein